MPGTVSTQKSPSSEKRGYLREKLTHFGLGDPSKLGTAIGVSRQRAHDILSGKKPVGVKVAKRIGEVAGVPFTVILAWQEGNGQ